MLLVLLHLIVNNNSFNKIYCSALTFLLLEITNNKLMSDKLDYFHYVYYNQYVLDITFLYSYVQIKTNKCNVTAEPQHAIWKKNYNHFEIYN